MSLTIDWCPVCDDGSLEGDPPMVTCKECGLSFHEGCSVNGFCSTTSKNSDEVSASECPQCSGEYVSEQLQGQIDGFREGYGLGLRLFNQRCLGDDCVEWPNSEITGPVEIEGLTKLSVPLAEYLSGLDYVRLPDLEEFDDEAAEILSGFSGKGLNLSGLQSLSETAAKLLSNVKGILNLAGLTDLSPETAKLLVGSQEALSLEGLEELNEETAEALIQLSPNSTVHLDGLTHISPRTATILASYNGGIELSGLEALSSELASIFAQHTGELILSPSIELEEEVISILKGKSGLITGPWFLDDEDEYSYDENDSDEDEHSYDENDSDEDEVLDFPSWSEVPDELTVSPNEHGWVGCPDCGKKFKEYTIVWQDDVARHCMNYFKRAR